MPEPTIPPSEMVVGLLDGSLRSGADPLLRPDDAGVMRGEGVFETTLVHAGLPRDLPQHVLRLAVSARHLDFRVPPEDDWLRGVRAVIKAWVGGDMALRLVATRGPARGLPTCYVTGSPVAASAVRQRTAGISVITLDRGFSGSAAAGAPWMLTAAKTLSYAVNMAALRHARGAGADDVIFVGSGGTVLEAATATVVTVRGRALFTPPSEGILDGITAARLMRSAQAAGWATARRPLSRKDLLTADGVFLVSSVRLVAPVISIDGVARRGADRAPELLALLDAPTG